MKIVDEKFSFQSSTLTLVNFYLNTTRFQNKISKPICVPFSTEFQYTWAAKLSSESGFMLIMMDLVYWTLSLYSISQAITEQRCPQFNSTNRSSTVHSTVRSTALSLQENSLRKKAL